MGKIRNLIKKIRNNKNISCKDEHNKTKNSMDLTEAVEIKMTKNIQMNCTKSY